MNVKYVTKVTIEWFLNLYSLNSIDWCGQLLFMAPYPLLESTRTGREVHSNQIQGKGIK